MMQLVMSKKNLISLIFIIFFVIVTSFPGDNVFFVVARLRAKLIMMVRWFLVRIELYVEGKEIHGLLLRSDRVHI